MGKALDLENALPAIKAWAKSILPTKTSQLTNDSGFITTGDIPEGAAASTTEPKMDGTAAVGTELAFARGDHRHPTDTSRAPIASPEFTGTPTAPTATSGTNTTQIATTAFVSAAVSGKADSSTTLAGYGITNAYTKTETDTAISTAISALGNLYEYKGSVATYANLPASPSTGDVYNVEAAYGDYPAGTNWAWNGTAWDALGGAFSITFATAAEVNNVLNS